MKSKEDTRPLQDLIDSFKSKVGDRLPQEPMKAYFQHPVNTKNVDEFEIPGKPTDNSLDSMTLDELKTLRRNIDSELSKRKKITIDKIVELLGRFSE